MLSFLKKLLGKTYTPLNIVYVFRDNILHNYRYLSGIQKGIVVAPVFKSNAYGHGLSEAAKILDKENAPFFCVDSLHEAYQLLKAKIKTPILIMGYVYPENLKVKPLSFSYAVYDKDQLQMISHFQKNPKVHIKIDTGMHRLGIQVEELENFVDELVRHPNIIIEGVMSHLAEPDNKEFTTHQIKNFQKALDILSKHGIKPKWRHIGATGGLLGVDLKAVSNMVRVGKALYGVHKDKNLRPALEFVSTLVSVKKIKKGYCVGYDRTFIAKKDMVIGSLSAGYYDGIDRRLSNKGVVSIEGKTCPIIGRVSMNITTIDISAVKNPIIGQKAIVYSKNPDDSNSVENDAGLCETIPYEILISVPQETRRVVV